jgi:hypothetical protein
LDGKQVLHRSMLLLVLVLRNIQVLAHNKHPFCGTNQHWHWTRQLHKQRLSK